MSVLIRGMEMPNRCFACPLCDVIDSEVNCVISHGSYKEYREIAEQTAINGRPSDCPLVSVPPHGDLIDRNALVRKFEEIEESIGYAEVPLALAVAGAINDIKKTPTVIEAEEAE